MHRRARYYLLLAMASILVLIGFLGYKKNKNQTRYDGRQPFVATYPEKITWDELHKEAVGSRESLIYGRLVDPIGAAIRVRRLYPLIERSTKKTPVSPGILAGLIFLESGGDSFAMSSADAGGTVQMLASTARGHGLKVDENASRKLRRQRYQLLVQIKRNQQLKRKQIGAAQKTANNRLFVLRRTLGKIEARLRQVDQRFNPTLSIPAAVRYLTASFDDYGREDWMIFSYHAGGTNAQGVLRRYLYGSKRMQGTAKAAIDRYDLSWTKLVFTTTPTQHRDAYHRLRRQLGDQTWDYPWRVEAAANAFALSVSNWKAFREKVQFHKDPPISRDWRLVRELEWFPPNDSIFQEWKSWSDLKRSHEEGELIRLPRDNDTFGRRFGLSLSRMGDYTPHANTRWVYYLIKRETAGLAYYIASRVRQETGNPKVSLRITSLVRDRDYQRGLDRRGLSPDEFSGHRTGYSIDLGFPNNPKVKETLEYVLWDLRYRGVIVWLKEHNHYHLTLHPERGRSFLRVWHAAQIKPPKDVPQKQVPTEPPIWERAWQGFAARIQQAVDWLDRISPVTWAMIVISLLWLWSSSRTWQRCRADPETRRNWVLTIALVIFSPMIDLVDLILGPPRKK